MIDRSFTASQIHRNWVAVLASHRTFVAVALGWPITIDIENDDLSRLPIATEEMAVSSLLIPYPPVPLASFGFYAAGCACTPADDLLDTRRV